MRYLLTALAVFGWALAAQAAPITIAYGDDPLQKMIVYPPEHVQKKPAPILVMVHGGAWLGGDMTDATVIEPKHDYWATHDGFMFVTVNYRLTPSGATALDGTKDVAAAVHYIEAHAKQWHGDPSRVVLMGHSAGGHIVALLGANPAAFGLKPWRATVALDSAAYDVRDIMTHKHFPYFDPAFGDDPAAWDAASPLAQLKKGATPFFLVCTPQGPFKCAVAQQFADAARAVGTPAQLLSIDMEHIEINDTVGEPGAYTQAIERFINRFMK